MELKELVTKCHNYAKEKEFWDDGEEIQRYISGISFRVEGNATNLILTQKIMLIVTELSEAIEGLRNGKRADKQIVKDYDKLHTAEFELSVKDTFEDEIADALIRIFDLCGYLDIDIEKHIKLKMDYNEKRINKHGKLF